MSRIIWHWYYVNGHNVTNPYYVKLLEAWGLLSQKNGSAVVGVAINQRSTQEDARKLLMQFLEGMDEKIYNEVKAIKPVTVNIDR
jgi:hypothetical protein